MSRSYPDLMPAHKIEVRCPVCLTLDCSSSMSGKPIEELREGVRQFVQTVKNDEDAFRKVDLCVVRYGGTTEVIQQFEPIDRVDVEWIISQLNANMDTPMGAGLRTAIDEIESWKKNLRSQGVNYYRPWLINITDGYPTDMNAGDATFKELQETFLNWKEHKKLIPWAFGTSTADFEFLKALYPKGHVFRLVDADFSAVFKWLSASLTTVAKSRPGDKVELPSPEVFGKIQLEI